MRRVIVKNIPAEGAEVELDRSEARHLTRVLRLGDGDKIEAIDGTGSRAVAVLCISGTGGRPVLKIEEHFAGAVPDNSALTVVLAVLKGGAMEWALEKCVELGVGTVVPLVTSRCVVKPSEKHLERWQRIADQALKQCGRGGRMDILHPVQLKDCRPGAGAVAYCDETPGGGGIQLLGWLDSSREIVRSGRGIMIVIGPEGGWTDGEREKLAGCCKRITLGPLVLRAETAALHVASVCRAFELSLL